jgi:hypothetical protein
MSFHQRVHEAFNARSLATKDVCDSFIVTPHFFSLAVPGNAILVGPRGSGKTTLMKMLQIESVNIWKDAKKYKIGETIKYTGVFVPTDRLWATQYEALKRRAASPDLKKKVDSIFGLHVFERFLYAVEYRSRPELTENNIQKISLSKESENQLVFELSEFWGVSPRFMSLKSLCVSVKEKWKDFVQAVNENDLSNEDVAVEVSGDDLVNKLDVSASIVNGYFGQSDHVWAFLFDELELAPAEIVSSLISKMRGGPSSIIFKLSMSPYHSEVSLVGGPSEQMVQHDYKYIDLTNNSDLVGANRFARNLAYRVLRSDFNDERQHENKLIKEPGSIDAKREFSELASKDLTFKEYLDRNSIVINDWDGYREDRLSQIRRIQYVVHIRNCYIKSDGSRNTLKRALDYYSGEKNIFKALEYNPRMIISFVNSLFGKSLDGDAIATFVQLRALKEMRVSFEALINTISLSSRDCLTLLSLVESVGERFEKGVFSQQFKSEPYGSFWVEEGADGELVEAIGLGVNAGAFIRVGNDYDESKPGGVIRGRRFRLSYLFAHKYKLPLQLLRAVKVSTVAELIEFHPKADQIELL